MLKSEQVADAIRVALHEWLFKTHACKTANKIIDVYRHPFQIGSVSFGKYLVYVRKAHKVGEITNLQEELVHIEEKTYF